MRKSFENHGFRGLGVVAADWVICGTRMRSRFYVNESSFRLAAETSRLAACALQTIAATCLLFLSARGRRRFFRSADRHAAGPSLDRGEGHRNVHPPGFW